MSEEQLQREWREEVRENFKELKTLNSETSKRVRVLEDDKTRTFGFLAAIQFVGVAAVWVFNQLTKSH